MGHGLARRGIGLVYGGAGAGVMGELAHAVLEKGGEVTGVMPAGLSISERAIASELVDLRIVSSMHERKALMEKLSDGFIALPGGLGTLDEFFEIASWAQLGMHRKPCAILNVNHYYDKLVEFLDFAVEQQFIKPAHRSMILVEDDPETLLDFVMRASRCELRVTGCGVGIDPVP